MLNKIYFAIALFVVPLLADALLTNTKTITQDIAGIVNILIPTAFALAVALFFYGVAKYIWSEGQGKDDGKNIMIWGVIALFVISSVWGIVYFIRGEIGVQDDSSVPIPTIGGSRSGSSGNNQSGNDNDLN